MIRIDENYRIELEDANNAVLVYSEVKISDKGKNKGEKHISETPYYYPSIHTALIRYTQLQTEHAQSVDDCIRITEETYAKIRKLSIQDTPLDGKLRDFADKYLQ